MTHSPGRARIPRSGTASRTLMGTDAAPVSACWSQCALAHDAKPNRDLEQIQGRPRRRGTAPCAAGDRARAAIDCAKSSNRRCASAEAGTTRNYGGGTSALANAELARWNHHNARPAFEGGGRSGPDEGSRRQSPGANSVGGMPSAQALVTSFGDRSLADEVLEGLI
jgi:hypothetical protein